MITDDLKKMLVWCGKTHAKKEMALGYVEPNDEIYKCIMPSIINDIIKGTYYTVDETNMDEAIQSYLDGYGSYYGGSFWLNESNNKYYFKKNKI